MKEYYIIGHSFAAPFVSDKSDRFIEAATAREAMEKYVDEYSHPAGLYAAGCWQSSDAERKGADPLVRYLSPLALLQLKADQERGAYSWCHEGAGRVLIDGELHTYDLKGRGEILEEPTP